MSLISTRNLLSPFTSTVNLVTIIVLALLFGIYRLSGGGVYVVERGARNVQSQAPRPILAPQNEPAMRGKTADPFADLIRPPASSEAAPKKNDDDLNDVERQLGLRK